MYLKQHLTLARIAVGFRISVGTAHACVRSVAVLPARRAPGLTRALREAKPGRSTCGWTAPWQNATGAPAAAATTRESTVATA
ncbi:transposase [Streptomyces sp. NBRC 110611]|nr:transposase [Streptomyces sp. NBRC 110611]GAU71694.1 transposase [Streptomyces sp. NBRC 110611]